MQTSLIMQVLNVAELAAIAAAAFNGRGDKRAADAAATEAMRQAFNDIDFAGRIVIGEGERDEAPMLFIGEELGLGWEVYESPKIDIAVDPLEGTNLCAYNQPNALTTIAIAPRGALLFAPDTYMDKIAAGPALLDAGTLGVDHAPADNVRAVAEALDKPVSEVNVCILARERHADLIAAVREAGARVRLIDDGDVFGAIATAVPGTGIDLYLGSGGSPEGVLAATGLKAIGGFFEGRFNFGVDEKADEKRARAEQMVADAFAATGTRIDLDGVLPRDLLVAGDDAAFIACGVTDGEMLDGVYLDPSGSVTTHSLIMNAADQTVRFIRTTHRSENGVVRF
ncbi:MAG: class II fructose-bisphosphatase [Coriobacteriales bacterium]|jgi:fructose-1,6-bisphosphatase class II|nr:class II fructose-bisphosphatase [Coriobacteriales bacterium]